MNRSFSQVTARDERLHALIADYLDREAAGQAPEPTAWLAEHAEFADDLRLFLEEHERVTRLGAPLRGVAAPANDAVTLAGTHSPTAITSTTVRAFGDYELLHEVARGGMGVVYKARQKSLERIVALKMILAGQLATKAEVERFRLEAHAAANLDHPQIVPIYEVGERDGQHYFSMKFVEGDSLAQAIAGGQFSIAGESQRRAAELVAAAARAVHYAHQRGVIHRDLKPANILLAPSASGPNPLLTDFGLAKRVGSDAALTHTGAVVGTPSYMAPEQAAGGKQITTAVDIYALGAILYELLTGQPPFRGDSALEVLRQVTDREPAPPRSLVFAIERDLETISLKCLEKAPERRYRSAEALADDLERWLAGEPIEARPATTWERTVKWARRRPAIAALVGVSFASAAALLIGGLVFNAELQLALAQVREQKGDLEQADKDVGQARAAVGLQKQQVDDERRRARNLHAEANSLRLVARSEVVRAKEPALALLLALEGARLGPRRADQNNALARAVADCREVGPLLQAADGQRVSMVRWLADGRVLTVSWNAVRLWDPGTGKMRVEIEGPRLRVRALALSPDEERLALTFDEYFEHNIVHIGDRVDRTGFLLTDQVARVYDTRSGNELHILRGHQNHVASVAFNGDGRRFVTASNDGSARIWDSDTGKLLHTLEGHTCGLASAEFTADGKVLTVSNGRRYRAGNPMQRVLDKWPADRIDPPVPRGWRSLGGYSSIGGEGSYVAEELFACLWDPDSGAKVKEFREAARTTSFFSRVRLDPTGSYLVGAAFVGVAVWDARTGKELHRFACKDDPVGQPVFDATGKRVLVPYRRAVHVWDLAAGREIATLPAETDDFRSAIFSPDAEGRHVLTTSEDRTARLWETVTGREVCRLRGHEQGIDEAAFRPDGRRVVTAGDDRTARIWNVEPDHTYERILGEGSWTVALAPDGKQVATGSRDGYLRLWDAASGKLLTTRRLHPKLDLPAFIQSRVMGEVFQVSYSNDGARLLTVAADGTVELVDAEAKPLRAGGEYLPFAPVRIHDATTGKEIAALDVERRAIRLARFSPDGSRVLTLDDRNNTPRRVRIDPRGAFRDSGPAPEPQNPVARIFDAHSGKPLLVLAGDSKDLYDACWDAKGERLCTIQVGLDKRGWPDSHVLRICDAKTGRELQKLVAPRSSLNQAAFSPDGRRLLTWYDTRNRTGSTGNKESVSVWDLATGKVLFAMAGSEGFAHFGAYSPDGKWIVTTAYSYSSSSSGGRTGVQGRVRDTYFPDRTARLWDAETGALRHVLYGHERSVPEASFSRDSRLLVTMSEDRTARVWDVATGKELITLHGHDDDVKSASLSSDGATVLTASWDGTARLWPVDPLPIAETRRPRTLTAEERERDEVPQP